jgi:hypothetical protein
MVNAVIFCDNGSLEDVVAAYLTELKLCGEKWTAIFLTHISIEDRTHPALNRFKGTVAARSHS